MKTFPNAVPPDFAGIISLSKWREHVGIARSTAWRWRRNGWLTTINISGRHYLPAAAVGRFKRRATAGEFAKARNPPRKSSSFRKVIAIAGCALQEVAAQTEAEDAWEQWAASHPEYAL